MSVPEIRIDATGTVSPLGEAAKSVLRQAAGNYRAMRADTLLVLALDEGTGAAPQPGESFALSGDLGAMSLLGLLNVFSQNRETGRLVIKHERAERVVMLKNGDVASVGSNAPEDRLGRFLVRLGKITETQLDDALRQSDGRRIGQILLAAGLLDAHELWSSIQTQITEIFTDVVQWEEGSFVFFRVPDDHKWPSTPPIAMQGLMLEAVRRADEMSVFRERIPSTHALLRPVVEALPETADAQTKEAFAHFRGADTSVAEIAQRMHVGDFEATRLAYQLLKLKAVELLQVSDITEAPFQLSEEDAAKLEVFNLAFREIRDEVIRNGQLEGFMVGLMKYMSDPKNPHQQLFRGVTPDPTGALPVDKLTPNLRGLTGHDPRTFLTDALNELTFFMLFQCGELLDPVADENLGRRVRLIHSALAK